MEPITSLIANATLLTEKWCTCTIRTRRTVQTVWTFNRFQKCGCGTVRPCWSKKLGQSHFERPDAGKSAATAAAVRSHSALGKCNVPSQSVMFARNINYQNAAKAFLRAYRTVAKVNCHSFAQLLFCSNKTWKSAGRIWQWRTIMRN